jgi:transcriptional regulator with XRE-family HTH domain
MPATPKRLGQEPLPGSVFLSDVLAANIRAARSRDRRSQEDLAGRMRYLGHDWSRATVSEVERSGRSVSLDEFFALAVALGEKPTELVMPHGSTKVDLGLSSPAPGRAIMHWLSGAWRVFLDAGDGGPRVTVEMDDPVTGEQSDTFTEWLKLQEADK